MIYVRLEREGFRPIDLYLFTTLTDRKEFPIPELVTLYGRRWGIELDLRHVKTTLKMERLDGKSVDIVQKELLLGLLAYNLLRGFMAMAALRAQRSPGELSLAQCWRRIQQAAVNLPMAASVATIRELKASDGIAHMMKIGKMLCDGLEKAAKANGLQVVISGPPTIPFMRFANETNFLRMQLWSAECSLRGIFFHPHHNWFVSVAHTEEDVRKSLEVADAAFKVVKQKFGG